MNKILYTFAFVYEICKYMKPNDIRKFLLTCGNAYKHKQIYYYYCLLDMNKFDKYVTNKHGFDTLIPKYATRVVNLSYEPSNFQRLQYAHFNTHFNDTINNLPLTITSLSLGCSFNKSMDYLPKGLIILSLGCNYNQPIKSLPYSLISLSFAHDFNQSIKNLPNSINKLTLGHKFQHSLSKLPLSLIHLELSYSYQGKIVLPILVTLDIF